MKYIKYVFGTFVVAIALFFISSGLEVKRAEANRSDLDRYYMAQGGGSTSQNPTATTTDGVTFLNAGSTTTAPFLTDGTDILDVKVQMTGTTSAAVLIVTYDVSNDNAKCDTNPNACNWSNWSNVTAGVAASTTPTITWRPDAAPLATSSLMIQIKDLSFRYVRMKFSISGSAGALQVEAVKKIQRIGQ